jgi:hypothetical protein
MIPVITKIHSSNTDVKIQSRNPTPDQRKETHSSVRRNFEDYSTSKVQKNERNFQR